MAKQELNPGLADIAQEAFRIARQAGWWDEGKTKTKLECICLIHSELSEAVEELRGEHLPFYLMNEKPEGWIVELADAIIRILDLVEHENLTNELVYAIRAKMQYNKTRPYRHGGKVA